jgi:hypothetical protein
VKDWRLLPKMINLALSMKKMNGLSPPAFQLIRWMNLIFVEPIKNMENFYFGYSYFHNGLAQVKINSKYGFIDRQGKIVMPAQIDEIQSEDFANMRGNNGFYDSLPNEGVVKARIGKKWGYVNTQGKIQIPMKFDEANDFKYGVAEVKLGSKILYIDRQGKVLPF